MSRNSSLTEIVALADLISSTVKDVVAEYGAAGLMYTVGSSGHKCGIQEPACMRVAVEAKIADHLLNKPEGVHVDEFSRLTGINSGKLVHRLDSSLLVRVLRLLCTKHCFAELKPNVFVNNRLSMKMVSSDPISALDPEMTHSQTPDGSPFKKAHGSTIFEFFGSHPKNATRFNQCMVGLARVTGNGMLGKVVCDVGGGYGHNTIDLLKEFPYLKIVVQDLPLVIEGQEGQSSLADNKDFSVALKQRVEHIPLDFFKDFPVKECDVYYLSHVVHDWPLVECKKILDNIHKATKPSSRLFIHEFVLQYAAAESGSNVEKAPEPLLPNWGIGRVRHQERTLAEFIEMGAASGFEFVKLWDLGEAGVVGFKPKA
ncbi:S-adenosyl-L-methionine-dependent methyltransferase [Roridomyces roridus]|uniref:S-adenosyl-L-methionine-dependent methyltransferase n=1 Tax=Roridomyces roridus TaxID=1738132 RepID=A0AAD7BF62_9AGAR|nr:S-adenosyl-L-methionine-dependent methyltransferase [Roridomyces roridus]